MPWKMNETNGLVVDDKNNPIWVTDGGDEKSVDYAAMILSLQTANKESAQRKDKVRELETKFSIFKDIEKPDEWMSEALKALEMMKNASDKEKTVEDQVSLRIEASTKPLKERLAQYEADNVGLRQQLQKESITNAFARSKYVQEKLVNPALAADLFANRFSLKDGVLQGMDDNGQVIYGAEGVAGFDEALAKLVDASSYKGVLLKGNDKAGSGAAPGSSFLSNRGTLASLADCKTEAEKLAYLKAKSGVTGKGV